MECDALIDTPLGCIALAVSKIFRQTLKDATSIPGGSARPVYNSLKDVHAQIKRKPAEAGLLKP
jgi:hypothetical protein